MPQAPEISMSSARGLANLNVKCHEAHSNASSAKKLDYEPQFEINFHTHPDKGKEVEPPSGTDAVTVTEPPLPKVSGNTDEPSYFHPAHPSADLA